MTDLSIEQRVANGATWLDGRTPDWAILINPDALDIGDEHQCVLGQVFGNYFDAPRDATVASDGIYLANQRGFSTVKFDDLEPLAEAWRAAVAARR